MLIRRTLPAALLLAAGLLSALGLSATTRIPVPTPPAGFYRVESDGGADTGRVTAFCFAPGHGNTWFGEGAPMAGAGNACGLVTLSALGDGWQSRQRCNLQGQVWDYATTAVREGPGVWRVRSSARPLSARVGPPRTWDVAVRRLPGPCPRPWRPGDYLTLRPHTEGEPWRVFEVGTGERNARLTLPALPPALAALAQ